MTICHAAKLISAQLEGISIETNLNGYPFLILLRFYRTEEDQFSKREALQTAGRQKGEYQMTPFRTRTTHRSGLTRGSRNRLPGLKDAGELGVDCSLGTSPPNSVLRSFCVGLVFLSAILMRCSTESDSQRLRIRNVGTSTVKDLIVIFPEDRISFGDITPDVTTVYKEVPYGVYEYAAYSYESGGETMEQPVIDWVGEMPMAGHSFTYVIEFDTRKPDWQAIQLAEVTADD